MEIKKRDFPSTFLFPSLALELFWGWFDGWLAVDDDDGSSVFVVCRLLWKRNEMGTKGEVGLQKKATRLC